ncbi:16S rRNA (guanine(527)-N(7))-methyltransferase RsmG [bacterium]|nr:MAG: 16S rRNA (guanine(527)-N(7))-methyltransferase RsmG [bacterium]
MMIMDQTRSNQPSRTGAQSDSPAERSPVDLELGSLTACTPPEGWVERCNEAGVSFDDGDVEKLGMYLATLMHANTRMNLTAIREEADAWDKHIFDALTLVPLMAELEDDASVIDIGSGGGLPGIPLAIVMPKVWFTLVDATKKKIDYLDQAIDALGLKNVRAINARAEQLGVDRGMRTPDGRKGAHREHYDVALARGVGQIAMLAELTVPLLKIGGLVLMTKGQRAEEELEIAKPALHLLHTNHAGTIETATGRIVVLEKQRKTPRDYPRRDGEPKRSPLGVKREGKK